MKTTIRDIIVNACDETGLRNRNQPVPAPIMETAYLLLKKRLAQYSNTNFLSFTRKEINFVPKEEKITIGEYELKDEYADNTVIIDSMETDPDPNDYEVGTYLFAKDIKRAYRVYAPISEAHTFIPAGDGKFLFDSYPDFEVENMQEIVRAYSQYSGTPDWVEMNFVSYEDFYRFNRQAAIYSYKPVSDKLVEFYVPFGYKDYNFKIIYNEFFDFTLDDDLNIPGQFIALFTAGLVYDLATNYPRLSDGTVALFKERLMELEENVRRSSSVNKFLARKVDRATFTYSDFVNGRFIGL